MKWCNYLIQANLYLVLFYAFYWLVLRKETFFNLNRFYLLIAAIMAGLIPLYKTTWFANTAEPVQQQFINVTAVVMEGYATPVEVNWTLGDVLTLIYFAGIIIMTTTLVYKLAKLDYLLKDKNNAEAFSFFRKIRISSNLPQQNAIKKHELTHVKHLHSVDVMFFEILSIINWFNPLVYLYKKSIKNIHEYIADETVLKTTDIDKEPYALLLVSKTFGISPHTLTNNFFNQSLLKQRIEMMNKTKSRKTAIIKYGLSAPLFLLGLVLSSATISQSKIVNNLSEEITPKKPLSEILVSTPFNNITDSKTEIISDNGKNKSKENIPQTEEASIELKSTSPNVRLAIDTNKNEIFTNVEVLPSFPGGLEAFKKFKADNLKYPEVAKQNKIQGRVFCQFVVEKDGSLRDIRVVRGIGNGFDEEAVRILSISPKWTPGIQNGEAVRVSYTMPIFFQLKEEKVGSVRDTTFLSPFINSSTDNPLIVIDGIEYKDKAKLKEIKPSDIQSINVLKGENAIEKYGDKGKNGIIEITTKGHN